jgi:hypothetical protein
MGTRPVKYRMVPSSSICLRNEDGYGITGRYASKQQITWQSKIATSKEGVTFGQFIMAVAERFVRRGGLEKQEAIHMAIEALKLLAELGDTFGCDDFSWDEGAIADEEMSYWDDDGGFGSNA